LFSFGCAREAAGLRNRAEIPELVDFHSQCLLNSV
jgi:hypothetical protein